MVTCHLCPGEEKETDEACLVCGRGACSAHRWVMLGLCHTCAIPEEMAVARAAPARRHPRDTLGIKWIG